MWVENWVLGFSTNSGSVSNRGASRGTRRRMRIGHSWTTAEKLSYQESPGFSLGTWYS